MVEFLVYMFCALGLLGAPIMGFFSVIALGHARPGAVEGVWSMVCFFSLWFISAIVLLPLYSWLK